MNIITKHYIDGAFVESHGREVMDIIKPTNDKVIGRVTFADEDDTRHAIAAAKNAFVVSAGQAKKSAQRFCAGSSGILLALSYPLRPDGRR